MGNEDFKKIRLPFFERLTAVSRNQTTVSMDNKEKIFLLVRKQLEELLNTRATSTTGSKESNICDFGLCDFSHLNLNSPVHKSELVREIEFKILTYIPLVRRVKVDLLENIGFNTLQLLIKAVLVEHSDHLIEFEALIEPKARVLKVSGGYHHA